MLGFAGYLLLSLGVPLDLLGVLDMNAAPGMVLLVPGFLFEFAVLPIWLIAKGFRSPSSPQELRSPALRHEADRVAMRQSGHRTLGAPAGTCIPDSVHPLPGVAQRRRVRR